MDVALFWLSDAQWAQIEPHVPKNQPGARRVDDRLVISWIIYVLKTVVQLVRLPGRIRAIDDDLQPLWVNLVEEGAGGVRRSAENRT